MSQNDTYFKKVPHKNIEYLNIKNISRDDFLHELNFELSKGTIYKYCDNQYVILKNIFRVVLDKHAPIKSKKSRGRHAPFMSKELIKAIINR